MLELPPALSALNAWRQFIVVLFTPSKRQPGKTEKLPVAWATGAVSNAHDPAIWLSFEEAAAYAATLTPRPDDSYGVGFVFTAADPFFFLDIDACLQPNNTWSAIALELLSRFQGAAVEVSHSTRGLHVIGQGTTPTPRKIKYADKFDLYTDGRFVALTGYSALGNAGTDHTAALAALVAAYLTPDTATTPGDWTTQACEGWNGPADDTLLIDRALRSTSANAAFGNKASFRDLWEANESVLAKAYPHPSQPWDASSADSALAQHLAFWTGKNCERIAALMHTSALAREKWAREDYLPRTILGVVARQKDVLQDKPREMTVTVPPPPLGGPGASVVSGNTFLPPDAQMQLFKGCVYVSGVHRVLIPGGDLLKPDQFRAVYGGFSYVMDAMNERVSRNAWEAFIESQCFRSPRADSVCFRPEIAPGAIVEESGRRLVNVWWPIETPRKKGDASPFLTHLEKMLPTVADRAQLLAYLAALVQYPGVKFQWAPLIQGVEGNGKTLIVRAIAYCVGDRYTHFPNTSDLSGNGLKFTGWLLGKLFVALEEIHTQDRRETIEALKPLITNTRIELQGKGVDQVTGDNRANIIACTNHKDAVPKNRGDRRWSVFFTAQQDVEDFKRDGMDGDYFPKLWAWFNADGGAIINDYLRSYAIPDALNPATQMHRAPDTGSTDEALALSLGTIEQEVLECVEQEQSGFAGGFISSTMLDRLLTRLRADRRMSPRKRHDMLVAMGYIHHPALNAGRVNNPIQPDGTKPRLYVRKTDVMLLAIKTPQLVTETYTKRQNAAMTAPAGFGVATPAKGA